MGKGQRNRRNPDYFKVQGRSIEEPSLARKAKRAVAGERARVKRRAGRKTRLGEAPPEQRARPIPPRRRKRPPPPAAPAREATEAREETESFEPPVFDQAAGRLLHAALHPARTLRVVVRHPVSSYRQARALLFELQRGHLLEHL